MIHMRYLSIYDPSKEVTSVLGLFPLWVEESVLDLGMMVEVHSSTVGRVVQKTENWNAVQVRVHWS
jgi:hypothetical protein